MNTCFLGLGSNLQSSKRILRLTIKSLSAMPQTQLVKYSRLYRSKPWGINHSQPDYYNMVVKILTRLQPEQLLHQCQGIEKQFGRVRKKHWGPRTLDIDILLYENKIIKSAELSIPHPHMLKRDFVIIPLLELNPNQQMPNGDLISVASKPTFRALCLSDPQEVGISTDSN